MKFENTVMLSDTVSERKLISFAAILKRKNFPKEKLPLGDTFKYNKGG
jgi:hypothetical protein